MKRLAIFIGGLLVLPAFGEVAPVFYEDGIEYSDVVYDENGNPILLDEYGLYSDSDVDDDAINSSVQNSRTSASTRSNTNRTTVGRTVPATASNAASNRVTAANSSRAVASRGASGATSARTTSSRAVSSRGTTSRTTSTAATRTTSNVAATRAAATRATGGAGRTTAATTRAGASGAGTVARTTTSRATTSGRTATAANSSRATTSRAAARPSVITVANSAPTVHLNSSNVAGTNNLVTLGTNGQSLYNANGAVVPNSSRASVRGNRAPTIRVSTMNNLSTVADVSVTAADLSAMDELAEMTDYCKAQYAACMDNYCNVLDDNQGRCSCSANITNYAQAEAALKSATEELQEVAQKIQYIGLSAREVETLFTQTEAELKMQTTTDTSQLKTSLDKVRDMIIEVQSGTASSNTSSGLSFDLSGLLDFTIDSTGFDLSALWGGLTGNTSGINNQRGAQLFNTATNRCKTNVLRSCTAAGVDASLITNAYDLEIDKECIAYERSLNDSNDQMVATVRNAKSVLQKARLLVEQSKNEYDMRGCINALDSCMQDEYVCGTDYEKCLDPSGRYIVNGEIVIGSDPGRAVNSPNDTEGQTGVLDGDVCSINLYNVWNYGNPNPGQTDSNQSGCTNAWNSYSLNTGNGNLSDYIDATLGDHDGIGMAQYIQSKIGWKGTGKDKDRNYGMCMSVLNKCQDYTYTGNGSSRGYNNKNEVVRQYLNRILVQIKAKQDEILAEHAESCITDVTTCLSQNNYPFDEETLTVNNVRANIAINACRSTIVTCMSVNGYSVVDPTPSDMSRWVCGITTGTTDCSGDDGNSGSGTCGVDGDCYTVSFDCTPGTGSVSSIQQARPGASVVLPSYGCSLSGNNQIAWEYPVGTHYTAGQKIIPTRNINVGAVYSQNLIAVTLNGNYTGASNSAKLYYANNTWYTDSGQTNQIPQLPNNMRPSYTGYTFRGFTDTRQSAVEANSGNLTSAGLVINQSYNFTKAPGGTTIYAAWARNCQYDECTLNVADNGTVRYTASCSGSTAGSGYQIHCNDGTEPIWYTYTLNDNGGSGSNPRVIYYQNQSGITNCPKGWYTGNSCTSGTFAGLTTLPTNGSKTYKGHYINNNQSQLVLGRDGKPTSTVYFPGDGYDATIYALWGDELQPVNPGNDFKGAEFEGVKGYITGDGTETALP